MKTMLAEIKMEDLDGSPLYMTVETTKKAFDEACNSLINTGYFVHEIGANVALIPEPRIVYVRTMEVEMRNEDGNPVEAPLALPDNVTPLRKADDGESSGQ